MSGEDVSLPAPDENLGIGSVNAPRPEVSLASVGRQLGDSRKARGLTVADVAKSIKLSVRQVEALEVDDWSSLPGNTMIRGFVRNYARLLNLNPDPLMSALDLLQMPKAPELGIITGPSVSLPQESKVARRDYLSVISGLTVLVLAVLAYFFFSPEMWQSSLSVLKSVTQFNEPVTERNEDQSKEESSPATAGIVVSDVAASADEPALTVPTPASEIMAAVAPVPVSSPPAPAIRNALLFNFAKPSWVEVRDKNGQLLLSQLCQADSQREIEGTPPFSLIVGNATHVTVQYKGNPVDLSKRSKDDVARVTVE